MSFIVSIIALIIAISLRSRVNRLEQENRTLQQMLQQLPPQSPEKPQTMPKCKLQPQIATQPAAPMVPAPNSQTTIKPKQTKNMENVFGKNVIGVIAAILMFIGVFAFGTLVFTSLTDAIKVVGMFLLSGSALAVGLFLNKKNPTVFSTIVTGCGIGMLYISIFLTHLHYHLIGDVTTFVLIFIWAAVVSMLSKKAKMPALSYLALTGCIISSILAQVYVVQQHMFIEITIYHFLTFLLLIIANKQNHALFKISSYTSIGLNTILSIIIAIYAADHAQYGWMYLCFILGLYNLAIGILVYRDNTGEPALNTMFALMSHGLSTLLTWIIPLCIMVVDCWFAINDNVYIQAPDYDRIAFTSSCVFHACAFCMIVVAYALQYFTIKDAQKRANLLLIAETILAGIILFAPIELVSGQKLGFLLPIAAINIVLSVFFKNEKAKKTVQWGGLSFLILDVISSLFFVFDYNQIGIIYSITILMLSCVYMLQMYGSIMKFPFLQCAIININLLLTLLNICDNWTIAMIIIVLANTVWSGLVQLCTNPPKVSTVLTEITESILAFILFWAVLDAKTVYPVGAFILSILLIPFMLTRLKTVIQSKNAFMSVWYGIKFTFYTFGTIEMFTGFTEQQFIVSVVLMILASICIAFGFWKEMKALRIYGLALILSSVAKMVVIDVWNQESMIRVLSLIAGALICFGISAVYTKLEAKQGE